MRRFGFYVTLLMTIPLGPRAAMADGCAFCSSLPPLYDKIRLALTQQSFPKANDGVSFVCVESPEARQAIGVIQRLRVRASIEAVAAVLDNFPDYAKLFPDLIKVEGIPQKQANQIVVRWTEAAPAFFMPRLVHDLLYTIDGSLPKTKVYRYSLKASKYLTYSEGLIVLLPGDKDETLFLEIDFYNADWSVLKILGSSHIWEENLEQVVLSDWAVKLKAESPSQDSERIRKEARKHLDKKVLRECIEHKIPFNEKTILNELHVSQGP